MFTTVGGSNECVGGTPLASSTYAADPGRNVAVAFNGVLLDVGDNSYTSAIGMWPVWIQYDFGSGNDKDIVQINVTARTYNVEQSPLNIVFQYSDDATTWFIAGSYAGLTWSSAQTRSFEVASSMTFSVLSPMVTSVKYNAGELLSDIPPQNTFVGTGEISGKISIEETPIAGAIVRLHDSNTGHLIRTTVSDGIGDYEFLKLRRDKLFDVIAEDPNKEWEKRVSSRRPSYESHVFSTRTSHHGETMIGKLRTFPAGAYRYWRLWIPVTENMDSYVNLDKIQLRDAPGGSNLCVTHAAVGSATQSSQYNEDYRAEKAFEELADFWHTASQSPPFWARYDFGDANEQIVVELGLQGFGVAGRQPKDFSLEASNDDSTWTTIASWTGVTGWDTTTIRTFTW